MRHHRFSTLLVLVCITFSLGFVTDLGDTYIDVSKNLDIFGQLYREINISYVEKTNPNELIETGIDAMLEKLDPYTTYINEEEVEDIRFMSTGQYSGIGAVVGKLKDKAVVLEVYENYPADHAGIKPGDELVMVEDIAIKAKEMKVLEMRNLLRGVKGSSIKLAIKDQETNQFDTLKLIRDRIRVKNVPYFTMVNDKVGYIALTGFTQDASREVENALTSLRIINPQMDGLILDMRGNPGGRLDESVKVANLFLPRQAKIVETRGRTESSFRNHYAYREPVAPSIPLAVLVDQRSASATEIVTGAIQDLDRGVIIGQKSFGKGLVQTIRPLGHQTRLKVTTAKYFTPSGRCIQALDYAQKDDSGKPTRITDSLRTAFKTKNGRTVYDGGGIEPDIKIQRNRNPQLMRALTKQGIIFDYANQYIRQIGQIKNPALFTFSDQDYQKFIRFVKTQQFDFKTEASEKLDELLDILAKDKKNDELTYNIALVGQRLNHQKEQELYTYQNEIARMIRIEILKRFYYQEGPVLAGLYTDNEIKEAVKVLCNPNVYQQILYPAQP